KSSPLLQDEYDSMICSRGTRPSILCPQVTDDISISPNPILHPPASSAPPLPLRRRQRRAFRPTATLAAGAVTPLSGSPLRARREQPLVGAPWAASCGLAVGGHPLRASNRPCSRVATHYGLLPRRATIPCRWPAAPLQGGLGCNRLPLIGGLGRSRGREENRRWWLKL
ncbi:hypothetical protein B296_00013095, partial [Ensete ventricosum]